MNENEKLEEKAHTTHMRLQEPNIKQGNNDGGSPSFPPCTTGCVPSLGLECEQPVLSSAASSVGAHGAPLALSAAVFSSRRARKSRI